MEGEYLIDCNRASLKVIFYKYLAENESQHISFNQFFKFCAKVKLYPDLITLSELKRIISNALKKNVTEDKPLEICYLQFEKIFKLIADHCFPSGNSIRLLISHMRNHCQFYYNVSLAIVAPIKSIYESASTKTIMNKPLRTTRVKSNSVNRRKFLNSSTYYKENSSKIDFLFSPREQQTMLSPKLLESRSPRLKIINIKHKVRDEQKINKIKDIFTRFNRVHNKFITSEKTKKLITKFLERYIESKSRTVRNI